MRRKTAALVLAALALAGCATTARGPKTADEIKFGIWASKNNLWEEAIFRWKKALETDPKSTAAHNNLAVAYEKKGLFEAALKEYEAALKLDPNNSFVKSNFQNCKENIQSPTKEVDAKKGPDAKK
jgi:Tfp pilus assembly protein PilF